MPRSGFFRKYSGEYKALVRLGAPVLLTQVGVICVSFADTMMVGLYGVNELAAAAFVNSVFLIPLVMLMGLAAGLTPLVGALFRTGQSRRGGTYREGEDFRSISSRAPYSQSSWARSISFLTTSASRRKSCR